MKLTIWRGLPGSGKSTSAKKANVHFEADMYFLRPDGRYGFVREELHYAHQWCLGNVKRYLLDEFDVSVSNTFTTYKELKPYIDYAKENGHEVEIITLTTNFGSIHNVPEETLKAMAARFESHEAILEKMNGNV
jgi:hypothetical protein